MTAAAHPRTCCQVLHCLMQLEMLRSSVPLL
jgi:hypothetical protein